jgi:hypothetical protein
MSCPNLKERGVAQTSIELDEFARRVERLCDFLLDKIDKKSGSMDLRVIQDLKEDAANIQFGQAISEASFEGLADYVNA